MVRPRKRDRHLPACVYFKHGAYWYVKKGRWTRLGRDLKTALEAYARLVEGPKLGGMPGLIDEAMADMRQREVPLAPKTLAAYQSASKILKERLAEFEPQEVTPHDVTVLRKKLRGTPSMANLCLALLSGVFAYALEEEIEGIESNPCLGVKRCQIDERERLILDTEYAAIYAKADEQLQVIMDLCIRTGQRIGAVIKIERPQLLEQGIRFGRHKTDLKGVIAWTAELRAVIERARSLPGAVRSLRYLFLGKDPSAPPSHQAIYGRWRRACKAAGVEDAQLRDLRAVAATEAEGQGKSATELLLHANPQTTERYLRKKREKLVEGPEFDREEKG